MIAEPIAAEIIIHLTNGLPLKEIVRQIQHDNDISEKDSYELVDQIREILKKNTVHEPSVNRIKSVVKKEHEKTVYSIKIYKINQICFYVEYETADAEWYNHPKFEHLEIKPCEEYHHYFRVEDSGEIMTLWVNDENTGSWEKAENHFLSGKFSMQVIQKIYDKEEKEWMGVFHAAGISNGKECILFFGDSGNGKSTLSAILMANGFDVLSDDFLPVESETGLVYRFPAALSIKKQAYDIVMSFYPELANMGEYENLAFGKTYRYLPPQNTELNGVPCKAIVHVKYDSKVEFQLEKIKPEDAFIHLVPDSWIHNNEGNVQQFIHWFSQLDHYQLIYSNNEKMVSAVQQIMNSDN